MKIHQAARLLSRSNCDYNITISFSAFARRHNKCSIRAESQIFSPDSFYVVTAEFGEAARIFDAKSGKEVSRDPDDRFN
jgi:hypothetical protein